ncbi:helix-turn-helix domain-containing protein [Escherichia coli]|nr:AraC family transcriptional regulator [Escherichia coli]HAW0201721.1 AraC family transcriptional regulator [Escherichia coli]HAW8215076.1 AraC family transcriptional regulator [Escherichia coli]HAX2911213.1 AraC family transcriptional regulator [Escherichia coli]HBB2307899.1 AraC family transcriptional regulator [Escherichia coli]
MIFVCSVVLVSRAFPLHVAGKILHLSEGDVFLVSNSERDNFLPHLAYISEVRVDEHTVRRYLESFAGVYSIDTSATPAYLRESFAHTALLHDVMHYLNSSNVIHSAFSEQILFSCLAVFASKKGFLPLLQAGMHSVADKVRNIFCTDLSLSWRLRDVCARLYMSESLLKKKLKQEGVSFSELLLDVRMRNARRLIMMRLSVNQTAVQCGYISASYFITVFRGYFGITPHRMLDTQVCGTLER